MKAEEARDTPPAPFCVLAMETIETEQGIMLAPTSRASSWRVEYPVEVFEKASANVPSNRRIGGTCSTDKMDRQQEKIIQAGMDFGPFLESGWFNDNHDPSTDALVGYPTNAELRKGGAYRGWYVEGYLLEGHPRADSLWMLANALQKTDRRLGFSVEGGIDARDPHNPNIIRKAIVREVAITRCPVNTSTALHVLAKSLSAGHAAVVSGQPVTGDGAGRVISRRSVEAAHGGSVDPTVDRIRKRKRRKLSDVEERALEKAARNEPITRSEAAALLQVMVPALKTKDAEAIADYHFRGAKG